MSDTITFDGSKLPVAVKQMPLIVNLQDNCIQALFEVELVKQMKNSLFHDGNIITRNEK
jgi:hypothetical protein